MPATPRTSAWPPSLPSVPTSRATRVTSSAKPTSWSTMVLMVSLSSGISPSRVDGDLLGQVAVGHRRGDLGDVAHLAGQVAGHEVDVVGEVLPGARHARHLGLAAELALGADLAGDPGDLVGERGQLVDHRVDGVLRARRISPCASTVIFWHRSPWATAVVTWAMSRTWPVRLRRHEVDVVGQVLPGAGHALAPRPGRRACPRCRPRGRPG